MALLKRKRSESEFSSSSGSTFSSPHRPDSSSFDFGSMSIDADITRPIPYGRTSSHLPSRTMKRFRNSRPSEQEVHENTLRMLYSARQQQEQPTYPHTMTSPDPTPTSSSTSHGQKSLHAFWNIQSPACATTAPPPPVEKAALSLVNNHTDCEDCGAAVNGGADDGMMDVDSLGYEAATATGCVACGKVVCGSCSVSNLGAEPRCLVCAGREGRKGSQWARSSASIWERMGVC